MLEVSKMKLGGWNHCNTPWLVHFRALVETNLPISLNFSFHNVLRKTNPVYILQSNVNLKVRNSKKC